MAKKYKDRFLYEDPYVLEAIIYCWDKGFTYYPAVLPNQAIALKFIPKVKIGWSAGKESGVGEFIYDQNQEMYDKIYDLYVHKYEQLTRK
jgi:hypothetical protein